MKVQVKKQGHYNHRLYEQGETLVLKDPKDFSKHWMHDLSKGAMSDDEIAEDLIEQDLAKSEALSDGLINGIKPKQPASKPAAKGKKVEQDLGESSDPVQ